MRGQGVAGMERPGSVGLGVERQGMEMQDGLGLEWNGRVGKSRRGMEGSRIDLQALIGVVRTGSEWQAGRGMARIGRKMKGRNG